MNLILDGMNSTVDSSVQGDISFDSDTGKLLMYDGDGWIETTKKALTPEERFGVALEDLFDTTLEEFKTMMKEHHPERLI